MHLQACSHHYGPCRHAATPAARSRGEDIQEAGRRAPIWHSSLLMMLLAQKPLVCNTYPPAMRQSSGIGGCCGGVGGSGGVWGGGGGCGGGGDVGGGNGGNGGAGGGGGGAGRQMHW